MKRLVACGLPLLLMLLLAELMSRLSWVQRGISFWESPKNLIQKVHYGFLRDILAMPLGKDDGYFDILILGGSALHPDWGNVPQSLEERLRRVARPFRIHNTAWPAHTSRDSWLKYRLLREKPFDLVVVYDSINDVRANNAPPDMYARDYSHFLWYRTINGMDELPFLHWMTPATVRFHYYGLLYRFRRNEFVLKDTPNPAWMDYGSDIKTPDPLRENLESVVKLAKEKREPVLLLGFAWYIPTDYTRERFDRKQLDYSAHRVAVELWGKPDNVARTMELHNQVIHGVADRYGTLYVDENAGIPKSREFFEDVCHLTRKGSERFVDGIEGVLLGEMVRGPGSADRRVRAPASSGQADNLQ